MTNKTANNTTRKAKTLKTAEITKAPRPTEHVEQALVINFCKTLAPSYPDLYWIFAVPNGAKLPYKGKGKARFSPQALYLLAEGLKPGALDLMLPVSRHGYHGLFIEMKRKPNKVTQEQQEFINAVTERGYCAKVCWDGKEGIQVLSWYLGIPNDAYMIF